MKTQKYLCIVSIISLSLVWSIAAYAGMGGGGHHGGDYSDHHGSSDYHGGYDNDHHGSSDYRGRGYDDHHDDMAGDKGYRGDYRRENRPPYDHRNSGDRGDHRGPQNGEGPHDGNNGNGPRR